MARACRAIDGILLVDKPGGPSSNAVLQEAKRRLGACKAGHTGSLDPLATGLLPVCFGEATKVSGFLLDADKRYAVRLCLGISTDSFDAEGRVTRTRAVAVTAAALDAALSAFIGEIEQVPPVYSALKQGGVPLYKRARAGLAVEVAARRVRVFGIARRHFDGEYAELDVHCGKGPYGRSLVHDLGERLGCGAHVAGLRRTALGPFDVGAAVTLDEIGAHTPLLPADAALGALRDVRLSDEQAQAVRQGRTVALAAPAVAGLARLYDAQARFLGVGRIGDDGRVSPARLFRSGTEFG